MDILINFGMQELLLLLLVCVIFWKLEYVGMIVINIISFFYNTFIVAYYKLASRKDKVLYLEEISYHDDFDKRLNKWIIDNNKF